MTPDNPLISYEGFTYLYSLLSKNTERDELTELFNSIIKENKDLVGFNSTVFADIKSKRKENQIQGLLRLIGPGNYGTILDVGCGSGLLSNAIALSNPRAKVLGVDSNSKLIKKCQKRFGHVENLSFQTKDAFNFVMNKTNIVISLHGCGNLTDRVIDMAIQCHSDVLVVPCCYSKIKRKSADEGYSLPISSELQSQRDIFKKNVLRNASRFEGTVNNVRGAKMDVRKELYRLLVNVDRLLYLRERGYAIDIVPVTTEYFEDSQGGRHKNSPMRYCLIGKRIIQ